MSGQGVPGTASVDEPELAVPLEEALTAHFQRPCRIVALRRQPYVYSTSFLLEELDVRLQDGTRLHLLFKHLTRAGMLEGARTFKPAFLYDPLREIETYRSILLGEALGSPVCYGVLAGAGRYGLLLEKVSGRELYCVGETAVWCEVARWLADMHDRFTGRVEELRRTHGRLLQYDAAFYRRWLDRAQASVGSAARAEGRGPALDQVVAALQAALERLATTPTTFLHGELYASNILVAEEATRRRVCPVDWEMAGLGPGLLDVAALSSGWDDANRRAIAAAYWAALQHDPGWPPEEDEFMTLLDSASLCVAVQWLGWSPGWSPPPEHDRDWLGEAVLLAERLRP
jgi:hypothetical protein